MVLLKYACFLLFVGFFFFKVIIFIIPLSKLLWNANLRYEGEKIFFGVIREEREKLTSGSSLFIFCITWND